jgi:hypothetical protein
MGEKEELFVMAGDYHGARPVPIAWNQKRHHQGAVLGTQFSPRLTEGARCDRANFVAADADIGKRLVGQVAEFVERATVANPALCNAKRVHGFVPWIKFASGVIAASAVDTDIGEIPDILQCK